MYYKILMFMKSNWLNIFLAIVPPLSIWFFLQKEAPDLSITVTSKTSVVSLANNYSDGIEIFHNKKAIKSLYVADIKVKNEGNQPIDKKDFNSPITFKVNGDVISSKVIKVSPKGLPVKIINKKSSVEIENLLLNSGDEFKIRLKVINPLNDVLLIEPFSRIKSIKEPTFHPYEKKESRWVQIFIGAISALVGLISLLSTSKLLKRFKLISISLPGLTLELAKELEKDSSVRSRVERLAEQLAITGHDYKSNVLLLRLKIENQLRDLAKKNDLNISNAGSLHRLSNSLYKMGVLEKRVVSLIRDISPVMNRELHESETYLNNEEFDILQHSALSVIAVLEDALNLKSDIIL